MSEGTVKSLTIEMATSDLLRTPNDTLDIETSLWERKINLDLNESFTQDDNPNKKNDIAVSERSMDVTDIIGTSTEDNTMEEDGGKSGEPKKDVPMESPVVQPKHLWVSNLNRSIRANDLKKHFGKCGKVVSAKVLTNGKNFYGYVVMTTPEQATECLRKLNKSLLENVELHVCRKRPDLKTKTRQSKGNDPKKPTETKSGNADKEQSKKENKDSDLRGSSKGNVDYKKTVRDLERKLKNAYRDLSDMKRKLERCERKNLALERSSRKESDQLRAERRHLNQEKEDFEISKRNHNREMSKEKAKLEKELDEVKALRIRLQDKVSNYSAHTVRSSNRRASPIPRSATTSSESRRYRETDTKPYDKYKANSQTLMSPPPPPGLTNNRSSQRNDHYTDNRNVYTAERKTNPPEKVYDNRYRSTYYEPTSSPRLFPAAFQKEPRRQVTVTQNYINDRSGSTIMKVPTTTPPDRNGQGFYAQNYGRSYGYY